MLSRLGALRIILDGCDNVRIVNADRILGEAQGLEFTFNICHPSRVTKGPHYIVNREGSAYRASRETQSHPLRNLPSVAICRDLLRSYFYYVHPFLPVLDINDFLTRYAEDPNSVSVVLLWSMFFAAASVS